MLDVHPAHHAATTWRDFFIHIATIVIGLLIAVGLEQTVELIHHHRQVVETREALQREHDFNVQLFAVKTEEFHRITPILEADLAVFLYLQKHPGAPQKDWPGRLGWFNITIAHVDSEWKTAQQGNVLALMPQIEARQYSELYRRLQLVSDQATNFKSQLYEARRFTVVDPDPSHLSPEAIARQIDLVSTLLLDHFLEGGAQSNLSNRFPEFSKPSKDEFNQILRIPIDPDDYKAVSALQQKVTEILAKGNSDSPLDAQDK
jgi:hypothetical protein